MTTASIFNMKTMSVITEGLPSGISCDETIKRAMNIASSRKISVIVEDYGLKTRYRVFPNKDVWFLPSNDM